MLGGERRGLQCGAVRGLFNHYRWECRGGDASPGWECCSTASQLARCSRVKLWGMASCVVSLVPVKRQPTSVFNYDSTPNNDFLLAMEELGVWEL